ncbi:hypothetical protein FOC1_g10014597 [Fusarium oxysporum f. sp. cubense race 1]|uniref:Uncharacterized protein n=1 Tax=Fusarium oxysporum f. sp. cubense (strain race 1) TaxID=1229664 RepID=N4UBP8_FUSC1|nr:hypothetical protein FOC1_g10014597 [Fusarium oxysporum f. sp. cubense race 1]
MQGRKKPVVLLSGPREGSDAEQHAGDWVGPGKADPRRDDVPSSQQRGAAGSLSNRSKKGSPKIEVELAESPNVKGTRQSSEFQLSQIDRRFAIEQRLVIERVMEQSE